MEKYKIISIEEKTSSKGARYLLVEFEDKKASSWDEKHHDILKANVGKVIELEIQAKGDFNNIIAIGQVENTITSESAVLNESYLSIRDEIIVSQVILKCANEMACAESGDIQDYGKYLCDKVNELTGAFKLALSNLKTL